MYMPKRHLGYTNSTPLRHTRMRVRARNGWQAYSHPEATVQCLRVNGGVGLIIIAPN